MVIVKYIGIFLAYFYISILSAANVGLLIMATGSYIQFIDPLILSAQTYFCTNHNVTYFVFTDQPFTNKENVIYIYQDRLGWPLDTMMRYHVYQNNFDFFVNQDYLFACDADMLFVGSVEDEILSERTATQHPGFVNQRGTYETNPKSTAYVAPNEGIFYFAGGFYGGTKNEFMKTLTVNIEKINADLQKGIIAVWHDESHWNRYCIDNPPTAILSPSYCYPQNSNLRYKKKLIALDKDHALLRQ